jgi:hypothetical protein
MTKIIKGLLLATITISFFSGCEKKIDPIDTYYVTVDFKKNHPKAINGDVQMNPKDSIYLDFTITSRDPMDYVEIQKNGVRVDTFRVTGAEQFSYSKVKGYMVDSAAGDYTYRVVGRTAVARFLGDGNKKITVTTKPDFLFWSFRVLFVPDTVNKTNKTYYSTSTGEIFNYNEGAANSAKIDFGYYWDTTGRDTPSTTDDLKHTIYALSAPQPQLNYYDISTWTKNATLLKKMPNTINFVTQLTSSGAINTLIKNNMTSGTSSKVATVATTSGNNVIGFKTVNNKYGAIQIRYVDGDSPAKTTSIQVDVKVQP